MSSCNRRRSPSAAASRSARPRPGPVPRADRAVRGRGVHARLHPPDRLEPGRVREVRRARAPAQDVSEVPQPEDIYLRTKEEGERRLERPLLEMISTALAAG